jgi:hypothetical protein
MSGKKPQVVHTVPRQGHWENSVNGRSTGVEHRTQESAAAAGRRIAIERQAEHSIHRRDGTIGQKNSYGGDPPNVRG